MTGQTGQHTPGEWIIGPTLDGDIQILTANGLSSIAIVHNHSDTASDPDAADVMAHANAHLITAAPELLETCQKFVALWPIVGGRNVPKATPEVIAVWQAAKAIIDKATN